MGHEPIELTAQECRALLHTETVGRVAWSTPHGIRIVPVNYTLLEEAIVFRTAPYSELGTHGPNTDVAFEVDQLDHAVSAGWSVVATGRTETIDDPAEIQDIQAGVDPTPWAAGSRHLYLRLRWRELTGRRLGSR